MCLGAPLSCDSEMAWEFLAPSSRRPCPVDATSTRWFGGPSYPAIEQTPSARACLAHLESSPPSSPLGVEIGEPLPASACRMSHPRLARKL